MENKIPAGNNKVVSLAYTLWVDGEPIDSADVNNPWFIYTVITILSPVLKMN